MPVQTTYPGVYIVEQTSSSHVITGVSTSVTAFVGAAGRDRPTQPTAIGSYADFVRQFGDPSTPPAIRWATRSKHFFANGGSQAIIVRALAANAVAASLALPAVNGITVTLTARSRGAWANGTGTAPRRAASSSRSPRPRQPDRPVHPGDHELGARVGGAASVLASETWPELSMSTGQPPLRRHRAGRQRAGHRRGHRDRDRRSAGTSEGSVRPYRRRSPGCAGRTLRLSVDQGAPADHVTVPGRRTRPTRTTSPTS